MIHRRNFLSSCLLVAGAPLLGNTAGKNSNEWQAGRPIEPFYLPNNVTPRANESYFISHRGVHLKQRIAGENTLHSLQLAKRAGFQCVEFDVRFTKDQKAVVIHDETINRTLRDLKGNKLTRSVYVKDLTFAQLRSEYQVYTENKKAVTIVPSFEEYLNGCNLYKVIPFVEIKDHELRNEQYDYLLNLLDKIIGRQNYIITSNNKVNDRLRQMNYLDVMVMGILYQTSFEHIRHWKQAIMAISASRFSPEQLKEHVLSANQQGILTESHADTMDKYSMIVKNGIDFISTDSLMPEYCGHGQLITQLDLDNETFDGLKTDGALAGTEIRLQPENYLEIDLKTYQDFFLYGVTLEIEFSGKCKCQAGGKEVFLETQGSGHFRYPVLLHKEAFTLKLQAITSCYVTGLRLTITRF